MLEEEIKNNLSNCHRIISITTFSKYSKDDHDKKFNYLVSCLIHIFSSSL